MSRLHPLMAEALAPFAPSDSSVHRDARPRPFAAATFEAFRLADGFQQARPLLSAQSRKEAVEQGKTSCFHKDKLVIRETSEAGTILHFYAIRKGAAMWVQGRRIEPLHEDWLFSMDADLDQAPFRVARSVEARS